MNAARRTSLVALLAAAVGLAFRAAPAAAQQTAPDSIRRVDLSVGRSFPIHTGMSITKVSVANPDIADIVVIGERDVVVSAKGNGETDAILWMVNNTREHYRVQVHSPADRPQIVLSVKLAEVRRDALRNVGVSGLYRDPSGRTRVGTGNFRDDTPFGTPGSSSGTVTLPSSLGFLSVLTDFGTKNVLALIDAEEQKGTAHVLAEPNLMAGNNDSASFLAGGELPIPVVQGGGGGVNGVPTVTIVYREFGVRLTFRGEIVSDSLIKLRVRPEVSSLDYGNAVTLSGFRIPALRTRRVESTVDVRRNESVIISGLFNEEREKVRTGIPVLMDIPILGNLFSSTRWQRNETELIAVVTPVVIDPNRPRPRDTIRFEPDSTLPALDALRRRLPGGEAAPARAPQE